LRHRIGRIVSVRRLLSSHGGSPILRVRLRFAFGNVRFRPKADISFRWELRLKIEHQIGNVRVPIAVSRG